MYTKKADPRSEGRLSFRSLWDDLGKIRVILGRFVKFEAKHIFMLHPSKVYNTVSISCGVNPP
jgi:hypothetical protein